MKIREKLIQVRTPTLFVPWSKINENKTFLGACFCHWHCRLNFVYVLFKTNCFTSILSSSSTFCFFEWRNKWGDTKLTPIKNIPNQKIFYFQENCSPLIKVQIMQASTNNLQFARTSLYTSVELLFAFYVIIVTWRMCAIKNIASIPNTYCCHCWLQHPPVLKRAYHINKIPHICFPFLEYFPREIFQMGHKKFVSGFEGISCDVHEVFRHWFGTWI